MLFLALVAFGPAELTPAGRRTLGVAAWMVTWWITECVPIIATAILPLLLLPLFDIATTRGAST